jgi:hypothetical protein
MCASCRPHGEMPVRFCASDEPHDALHSGDSPERYERNLQLPAKQRGSPDTARPGGAAAKNPTHSSWSRWEAASWAVKRMEAHLGAHGCDMCTAAAAGAPWTHFASALACVPCDGPSLLTSGPVDIREPHAYIICPPCAIERRVGMLTFRWSRHRRAGSSVTSPAARLPSAHPYPPDSRWCACALATIPCGSARGSCLALAATACRRPASERAREEVIALAPLLHGKHATG